MIGFSQRCCKDLKPSSAKRTAVEVLPLTSVMSVSHDTSKIKLVQHLELAGSQLQPKCAVTSKVMLEAAEGGTERERFITSFPAI